LAELPTGDAGKAFGQEGQFFICATCGKNIPITRIEGECVCGKKVCKECGKKYPLCASCGWVICIDCHSQSRVDKKHYHRKCKPSECLIVTTCFGSPHSEEVKYLKGFRDETVLKTCCGNGMMNALERIYYSFSPQVAAYLENNPTTRNAVKSAIVIPLLQSLSSSERFSKPFANKELRVILIAWLSSINLTIGLTFWKLISVLRRERF